MRPKKLTAKTPAERSVRRTESSAGVTLAQPGFVVPSWFPKWLPTLVVGVTFLAFLPVLKNDFVDLDSSTLMDNPSFRALGRGELKWTIAAFQFGQYQPLLWLSFALDYVLWWMDPFGYHWTSLLLHLGSTVVFYHLALRLIALARTKAGPKRSIAAAMAAAWAALIFALHPLRAEPVAWISVRADIFAALLVLLSLYCYLRAHDSTATAGPPTVWMRLSVIAYVCSLLAGPAGIMLPIVFLVLDAYPLRRSTGLTSPLTAAGRQLYWEKMPYFLAVIVFLLITVIARRHAPSAAPFHDADAISWILHQLAAPAFYLSKVFFPVGLSPAYELRGWFLTFAVLAGLIISMAAVAIRKRWPGLSAAWFCYLLFLLPVCRTEFPAQQILADRYTYLAALPWALCIGAAALPCFPIGKADGRERISLCAALAVIPLIALGILTWAQVATWHDSETLWKKAVAASQSSRAYFNLAALSEAQGRYDDAVAYYRRVLDIDSERWEAHEKAALLLQKRGNIAAAVEHYRLVVRLNELALDARDNLAAGLVNLGHVDEAVQHLRKLLELAPERNAARIKLGTILAVEGHAGEAAEVLKAAAEADPDDGKNLLRLGQVLAAQGKLPEAVQYFRAAVRLQPEDAESHESLGRALLELGKKDEAAGHLRQALRILRSTPAER